MNPYFTQKDLHEANKKLGIITQAWSPIGGALIYHPEDWPFPYLLENPILVELANLHHKTPAQIVIRWHLQNGESVIPKSVKENRIIDE